MTERQFYGADPVSGIAGDHGGPLDFKGMVEKMKGNKAHEKPRATKATKANAKPKATKAKKDMKAMKAMKAMEAKRALKAMKAMKAK